MKSFSKIKELLEKASSFKSLDLTLKSRALWLKFYRASQGNRLASASQKCDYLNGQILCCIKIMDVHFENNSAKYIWDDNLAANMMSSDELIICSQVSVKTLLHCWNYGIRNYTMKV